MTLCIGCPCTHNPLKRLSQRDLASANYSRLHFMRIELDHLFICTKPGAPAAEELVKFGLREGPPNQHPGQGTASRRFAFQNAMLELVWVSNEKEAQGAQTRRTLLWDRWSDREGAASPFGICLRPGESEHGKSPFLAWEYRPAYLPDPLVMYIGEAGVEEPMWVYLDFMRRVQREQWFIEHPVGIREMTSVAITGPVSLHSDVSKIVVGSGVITSRKEPKSLLEIEFDCGRRKEAVDFRPHLPLIFKL